MPGPELLAFRCEVCKKKYRLKPEFAGRAVRCKCGHTMTAPPLPPGSRAKPEPQPGKPGSALAELFEDDEEETDTDEPTSDEAINAPLLEAGHWAYHHNNSGASGGDKWWYLVVVLALLFVAFGFFLIFRPGG